jgi:hypothetical protein
LSCVHCATCLKWSSTCAMHCLLGLHTSPFNPITFLWSTFICFHPSTGSVWLNFVKTCQEITSWNHVMQWLIVSLTLWKVCMELPKQMCMDTCVSHGSDWSFFVEKIFVCAWMQVFIATVVDNFLYPVSAIYSHVFQHIDWAGVQYWLQNGKICQIQRGERRWKVVESPKTGWSTQEVDCTLIGKASFWTLITDTFLPHQNGTKKAN